MKRFLLVALSAAMLFICVPNQTVAATKCEHRNIQISWSWKSTGQGYSHSYSVANGISAGCGVTIEEYCRDETCKDCGETVRTIYTGNQRHNHEIKSHNTW